MQEDVREPARSVVSAARQDRFTGPLGPLETRIRAALSEEGFTPGSVRCVTGTMRRLSCWMEQRGVAAAGLTPEAAAEFLADSSDMRSARRGLGTLLRLLRSQAVIPPEHDSAGDSAAGMLLIRRSGMAADQMIRRSA